MTLLFLIGLAVQVYSQGNHKTSSVSGIGLKPPLPAAPLANLYKDQQWPGLSMAGLPRGYSFVRPRSYRHTVKLDSTGKYVIASETLSGHHLRVPRFVPFTRYKLAQSEHVQEQVWRESSVKHLFASLTQHRRGPGGVNIDIPVPIKSQTFQKIFGGSSVGLNVQGDIRIEGGFRNEKRSEVRTSIAQGSNTNFKMTQTQRFTVTGRIGEKVTVNVDQDSERAFDFDNNIKLNYRGFEDEIIQSIEAGNISLSLPATRFVTFSGKNTGLFGVKMKMQLGDLHVTTIASQEKGESQRLKIGGGATEGKQRIEDYRYKRFTYFFLDDFFRRQYRNYSEKWVHMYDPARAIKRIEVYKSKAGYEFDPNSIRGWAILDPNSPQDTLNISDKEVYLGHFIRLEPEQDYVVENSLGYIIMNQPLGPEDVLAVAFEDSSGRKIGDIDFDAQSDSTIILKLIKAQSPTPSFKTWNLEWKNVYSLGARNIEVDEESFKVKIFYQPPSGSDEESQGEDSYLHIFGLDVRDKDGNLNPDYNIDIDDNLINRARGELIFPNLRPFDPDTVFIDFNKNGIIEPDEFEITKLDPAKREPMIYDTTSQSFITQNSRFYIEVVSKNRSANYSLGFNVIENSEEVILNGQRLQRGRDYTIDYLSGTLTILDERATDPNAQIDITYERNQLFQLEKKTILGTRAEYRFGENNFLGGTILYLNERTLDTKVRVGQGPMRNVVWDLNTSLNFKPNFLTRALDALPLITAQQPSSLKFEGEIAQVIPNPNTLNNRATGDDQGVAYIDDFESAKRVTPLGVQRRAWTLSSAPQDYIENNSIEAYMRSSEKRGRLIWYNPFGGWPIKDIWPKREVTVQTGQTTDILTLVFMPHDSGSFPVQESWGGIMRALSPGFYDQTESKFLEIMVRGDKGILHIDLGQISEDVIPNRRLDTEDKLRGGIRNNTLEDDEDVGLDGMPGKDPEDWWDINGNGVREPWEPISWDDWAYSEGSNQYDFINGTENNKNDGTRIPNTEDLNGNGTVDRANNYFSYTINLDKLSPDTVFIASDNKQGGGWTLYRIPLRIPPGYEDRNRKRVGNPDLSQIQYARIWINGVTEETVIRIAEINLVGNEWKELGVSDSEEPNSYNAENDTTVAVTVVNTHDNPKYQPPPGVEGKFDRLYRIREKEQALVLDVNGLKPGQNGIAQKTFFQPQNYIYYNRLRMFIYARDEGGLHITPDSSTIEVFFRFGSDINNYYEIRERVYAGPSPMLGGWDERNHIDIEFIKLTSMKLDSSLYNPDIGAFEKEIDGKLYRIKGNPSITNVRTLIVGVKNLSRLSAPFYGQIWLNELRLSEVQKNRGIAMRARMDLRLSDFMSVNGEINRQDADFHNVATRFGSGDNRLSMRLNSSVKLDRFFPQSWGISLPLNLTYNESRATPKYFPGRDIEVIPKEVPADKLAEIQSFNRQQGVSVSFRKSKSSKNFLLRYTIDRLSANLSHTRTNMSSATIRFQNRVVWKGALDYSLQFGQNTFIRPLGWAKKLPLLSKLADTRLYYLPRNISAKISGNNSRSNSETRSGVKSDVFTYDIVRSYNTTYKIFDNLTTTFSRNMQGDFRKRGWQGLFSGEFEDLSKSQNFRVDYSPTLVSWLNQRFSYNATYRYVNNIQQKTTGKSATVSANVSAQLTLRLSQLFRKSSSAGNYGRRRRTPPGARRRPPGARGQKEGEKKKEEKQEDKKKRNPVSLLKGMLGVLRTLDDINVSYSRRRNYRNVGLKPGDPSLRYTLGFSTNPGLGTVPEITTVTFTNNENQSFNVSTGLRLGRSLSLKLRFNHSSQANYGNQITGSYSNSWMQIGNLNMPFPEWTFTWSNIERFKLFRKFANSINISHNVSGKRSVFWKDKRSGKTKEDFSFNFTPLLKLSINWKNGMVTNLDITRTRSINESFNINTVTELLQKVGGQRNTRLEIRFTTTYSKRSGFRIPFLSKKELKNSVDFSLSFTRSMNRTEQIRGGSNEWVLSNERTSWTFEPRVTYEFSSRVRGSAKFIVGRTKSTRAGETFIREFGIDVNISIRGN